MQAARLGAEILIGAELISAAPADEATLSLELTSGTTVHARTGIAATGVHYRRLEAPGVDRLIGAGAYYGSSPSDAPHYRDRDVFIVGAANSAGQAALHLADFARQVTLICRGASIDDSMSRYLVQRIQAHKHIELLTASQRHCCVKRLEDGDAGNLPVHRVRPAQKRPVSLPRSFLATPIRPSRRSSGEDFAARGSRDGLMQQSLTDESTRHLDTELDGVDA